MVFKLLILNFESASVEEIKSIVHSEYPNAEICTWDGHDDIFIEINTISPEIILFDLDNDLNNQESKEELLQFISHSLNLPVIALSSENKYKQAF